MSVSSIEDPGIPRSLDMLETVPETLGCLQKWISCQYCEMVVCEVAGDDGGRQKGSDASDVVMGRRLHRV